VLFSLQHPYVLKVEEIGLVLRLKVVKYNKSYLGRARGSVEFGPKSFALNRLLELKPNQNSPFLKEQEPGS
jgi:hypothetical protein